MATILVVDDDAVIITLAQAALGAHGHRVLEANSGEAAIALFVDEIPDLVVTDIVMPGMDGFALASSLRDDERTRDIPVIFLSGMSSRETRQAAFRVGAADFLPKPFSPEELVHRVANALSRIATSPAATDASDFTGSLAQLSVPSLLNVLELERMTGTLRLTRGEEVVQLSFLEGRLATQSARTKDAVIAAMRPVVQWGYGRFAFQGGTVDGNVLELSVSHLLIETARLNDELR